MMNRSLVELQETYKFRTDKGTRHFYLEVYDELFRPYKFADGCLLEIGVEWGGSLALWNTYFDKMKIIGCDIAKYLEHMPDRDRVSYVFQNAYDAGTVELLRTRYPQFDIIIDDGPHNLESQINTTRLYSPLIERGLLLIEDVDRGHLTKLVDAMHQELTGRQYSLTTIDKNSSRGVSPHMDDALVVVEFV